MNGQGLQENARITRRKTSSLPCPARFSDIRTLAAMGPILEDITDRLGVGLVISDASDSPFFTSRIYARLYNGRNQLLEDVITLEAEDSEIRLRILSSYDHDKTIGKLAQMALLGEIYVGLAHDFNNLLTVLGANLELLDEALKSSGNEEMESLSLSTVGDMRTALDMGADLCRRVQRLGTHRQDAKVRTEDISSLVESALRMTKALCEKELSRGKNVTIENRTSQPSHADVVYSELHMAVLNILFNAIRHSGTESRAPKVVVDTYGKEDLVFVSISNNGPPIPDEIRESLFQKPLTSFCVQGYGLYVASRNIASFGGRISFDSDPELTTFRVSVPAWRAKQAPG